MQSLQHHHGAISTLETVLRLNGLFRHRLQPLGVSPLQASIVLYLERHPECDLGEIVSALCILHLSAVEAVQRLQKNGWICKPRVNANRKIVRLQLTEKGTALAQKIKETIDVIDKLFALADSRQVA